ncbi:MAG: pilus assembly protein TadG-related protein [Candidatus Methylomirabilales bacterium]
MGKGRKERGMKGWRFRNQQGTVLVFTLIVLVFLLVMGGLAIDLAYHASARGELQRSMDAAALAGAGKLGFNDTVFPVARQFAQQYGALNPYRVGPVTMNLNDANASTGDIVLGIWCPPGDPSVCPGDPSPCPGNASPCPGNAGLFYPCLDGTRVNAVKCQYGTTIPTSLLALLGFTTLPVAGCAIATSNPPASPPEDTCVFPIGLSDCPFTDAGSFTSQGCGVPISFISSSGQSPGAPPGTNTAAWVNLDGQGTPSASYLRQLISAMANGTCPPSTLEVTDPVGTNNGMIQNVMNTLEPIFVNKYTTSDPIELKNASGEIAYSGKGWEVYVPVLNTSENGGCPPQAINGTHEIIGWTRFVMTQVINRGRCAVDNPKDPQTSGLCPDTGEPALRAIFGYYGCELDPAPPNPTPAPRSALATRLRLVQ